MRACCCLPWGFAAGEPAVQHRPGAELPAPDLAQALRQNAGTASKGAQRFRKLAVGAQIALSVLLLGGAGLFVRTLDNLRHQPVDSRLTTWLNFSLDPTISGYGEDRAAQIVSSALDAVRRVPA